MEVRLFLDNLSHSQKIMLYSRNICRIINANAIFSDETSNYRIPSEPTSKEDIKIRIRTAKNNVDDVILHYTQRTTVMKKVQSDNLFDYFEGKIPATSSKVEYYFEIIGGNLKYYYNKKGLTTEVDHLYDYKIIPNFNTPDWAKGAVMYQIFIDRFCNGDKSNDVLNNEYLYIGDTCKEVKHWDRYPSAEGFREFYGGDLKGVMDKLDYLSDLGIEAIYFNPVFVSPSNHKYDIQDYDYVDPHLGVIIEDGEELVTCEDSSNEFAEKYIKRTTSKVNLEASNKLLIKVIEEAHKRGIKVILDGVFNHCGSFNKWMDKQKLYYRQQGYKKGAYLEKESPYHNYFHWYGDEWPDNNNYDGWWGHDTLPKLNYEASKELYEYIMEIAKKWVSPPYNADGWRLDVAADLGYTKEFNHKFWRDFRDAVKEANPNAIILAEHYGDAFDWLQGDQWDTVMNYDAFMEPITWFLTGMEKHSDNYRGDLLGNGRVFYESMRYHMSRFYISSLDIAMNQLSNHDHSRFLTRTNRTVGRTNTHGADAAGYGINKAVFREAIVMQMTLPGAPTLYYGDEAGVVGWTDPDNRRTYPWGKEDKALIEFHKDIIRFHKSYKALRNGSYKLLQYDYMYLSYARWNDKEKFIIIINNDEQFRSVQLPVWQLGLTEGNVIKQVFETTPSGYSTRTMNFQIKKGTLKLEIPPTSAFILKNR